MLTSIDIFNTIKVLSTRTLNPCQRILFSELAANSSLQGDGLLVVLLELENRGLVKIHHSTIKAVSLTLYSSLQSTVTGGLNSEDC